MFYVKVHDQEISVLVFGDTAPRATVIYIDTVFRCSECHVSLLGASASQLRVFILG